MYPSVHPPAPTPGSAVEILPARSTYRPNEDVVVDVRGHDAAGELTVWHLGDAMSSTAVDGPGEVSLGRLAPGGYGVELTTPSGIARTAVEVTADPRSRLRYGFVASYVPGRDIAGVVDNVRRLHLNAVQFYDWAYRHADLLAGGEEYRDALDQPVSLDTVRRLVAGLREVEADAIGYAAVYAVGKEEWSRWEHLAMLKADGEPYSLGDFLFLVDPAAGEWLEHFGADLAAAVRQVGFDGFHLDQYGYPRRAALPDGTSIDVAGSFDTMIRSVRSAVPEARLVFNNVNDFPTWVSAHSPQDAVYIEVWPPHVTLGSLARVVTRARSEAEGKPVVIAAYQHVYDSAPAPQADLAAAFTMATLYSHGATQLLAGEADRVLVDPYYVRNHVVEESTAALLKRWYDFLVEHDELLMNPAAVDVTGAWAGAYNETLDVTYDGVEVIEEPTPGAAWRRVVEVDGRLVVHLINLVGQDDTLWDAPRNTPTDVCDGVLRVRRVGAVLPRIRVADPDREPRLRDLEVSTDGEFAVAHLPTLGIWQTVVVDLEP